MALALALMVAIALAVIAAGGCTIRFTSATHLQRSNHAADLASAAGYRMATGQAEYDLDADQVNFTINNDTDQAAFFGAAFVLETQRDGVWYMIPYKGVKSGTEMTWPAIAYQLPARGSGLGAIRLSSLDGIEAGRYRLIKEVFSAGGYATPVLVVAHFAIESAMPTSRSTTSTSRSAAPASGSTTSTSRSAAPASGLATTSTRLSTAIIPPVCERLWNLEPGQAGFSRIGSYRLSTYFSSEVVMTLVVRPQAFDTFDPAQWERIGQNAPALTQFWKKTTPQGVPYYLMKTAVSWDAEGGRSGTNYTQSLHLAEGGLGLQLDGEASQADVALDIVSLDTLRKLTAGSAGAAPSLPSVTATGDYWRTDFKNDPVSLSVTLIPPPFDTEAYAGWADAENVTRQGEGTNEYYMTDRLAGSEAPNAVAIAYRTPVGLVEVRGGVPYRLRQEIPRETLDFITIDYVRELIARIQ